MSVATATLAWRRRRRSLRAAAVALTLTLVVILGLVRSPTRSPPGIALHRDDALPSSIAGGASFSEGQMRRRLLATSNTSTHSKPVWERCDYETGNQPGLFLVLYAFLVFVLFLAIAILADDHFVPSLEGISESLNLSEDVAGATFMAAGSSAPELFTSFAGVNVDSDVGVGTIVGSAVFNILVIVALSGALAGTVLQLEWRIVVRDSVVYSISIGLFILFAWDGYIELYETILLLLLYAAYLVIMVFNQRLMAWMDRFSSHNNQVVPCDDDVLQPGEANDDDDGGSQGQAYDEPYVSVDKKVPLLNPAVARIKREGALPMRPRSNSLKEGMEALQLPGQACLSKGEAFGSQPDVSQAHVFHHNQPGLISSVFKGSQLSLHRSGNSLNSHKRSQEHIQGCCCWHLMRVSADGQGVSPALLFPTTTKKKPPSQKGKKKNGEVRFCLAETFLFGRQVL
eukprot:m.334407 g.334407  ORF g.334407 m.334407 type:complete len:456 (-) comp19785_c0_seq12:1146-2513(-)